MVGADPRADIAAARRVGLRGVLVLTGKTSAAEARAGRLTQAAVAADLRAVVAALD